MNFTETGISSYVYLQVTEDSENGSLPLFVDTRRNEYMFLEWKSYSHHTWLHWMPFEGQHANRFTQQPWVQWPLHIGCDMKWNEELYCNSRNDPSSENCIFTKYVLLSKSTGFINSCHEVQSFCLYSFQGRRIGYLEDNALLSCLSEHHEFSK